MRASAEEYQRINVMTAGTLKSVQLLVEKSVHLMKTLPPPGENRNSHLDQIQNIIAQIQRSLNLEETEARMMHKVLAQVWDALETRDPVVFPKSMEIMVHLQTTLYMLQGKMV